MWLLTYKHESPYDQPTAARQLLGLLGYVNDFSSRAHETLYVMTRNDTTLDLYFNCKAAEVQASLDKPGEEHLIRVAVSQNIGDNMGVPHIA